MRKKNSSNRPRKAKIGGIKVKDNMSKITNFAEIAPNLPFTEYDFYDLYRETFEKSELGRIKHLLPLREMAESFGLVNKSMKPKLGREHPLPVVLRDRHRPDASADELQAAG